MVIGTSSALPSRDGIGVPIEATPSTCRSRSAASCAAAFAAVWSSEPERAVISTFSVAGRSNPPLSTISCARPNSPIA